MAVVRRFFVDPMPPEGAAAPLGDAERKHARVLRLERGAAVELFDGRGASRAAVVESIGRDGLTVRAGAPMAAPAAESPLRVTVAQGLCRGARMDEVVRHGTELGVVAFVPVRFRRSTRRDGNLDRWRAIARDAARQSGRSVVPGVSPVLDLDGLLAGGFAGSRLLLHPPGEGVAPLAEGVDADADAVELVVGPEGGLEPGEVDAALRRGYRRVSLGPRILRTETAGLAAVAALQALRGDLGRVDS